MLSCPLPSPLLFILKEQFKIIDLFHLYQNTENKTYVMLFYGKPSLFKWYKNEFLTPNLKYYSYATVTKPTFCPHCSSKSGNYIAIHKCLLCPQRLKWCIDHIQGVSYRNRFKIYDSPSDFLLLLITLFYFRFITYTCGCMEYMHINVVWTDLVIS